MSNEKIQYTVEADEEAFLKEFGTYGTDKQFGISSAGFKGPVDVSTLPDPDTVDPKTDPATARNILLNPKSTLHIAERPFVFPLVPYLTAAQQQVPHEIRLLKDQYNIYLIKYSVDAEPEGKEKFTRLELRLDYPDKQGFLTHSMAPDTKLEERFSTKVKITTGLDYNLNFIPGITLKPGKAVGGGVELAVEAGFLLHWEYKLLVAKVIALGKSSSHVKWIIKKPNQMIGSIALATVLCVPKGTKELPITVEGSYRLERGFWWWHRETTVNIKSSEPIIVQLP